MATTLNEAQSRDMSAPAGFKRVVVHINPTTGEMMLEGDLEGQRAIKDLKAFKDRYKNFVAPIERELFSANVSQGVTIKA